MTAAITGPSSRAIGLPKGVLGKMGISVSGADSNRVYARSKRRTILFIRRRRRDVEAHHAERNLRQRALLHARLRGPQVRTRYELNVGFNKSIDAGKTWTTLRPPHGDNHDMWIAPNDPMRMIEANDGGANVSVNGGQTWTAETMPTAQFYHVITTAKVPYEVCGAQQDNSTACVSSRGNDGERYDVGGGESGYVAADPRTRDVFYAGSYGGLITRYNRETGQQRAIDPYPDNPMGYPSQDITERFQWTFPIVFAPLDPTALFVGSQHVWKTTNGGQSWARISPDLTRHDPATMGPSGGVITKDETGVETYATVFTIAPSPKDGNLIWAGSDGGYAGDARRRQELEERDAEGMPDFARISLIEASPFRPGTAHRGGESLSARRFRAAAYRTDDYGETWTTIVAGVDARLRARSEDPAREAATSAPGTGLCVVRRWREVAVAAAELPVTPVHDIKVEDRDLDRDARPLVLRDGQHLAAAADGCRGPATMRCISTSRTTCCAGSIARCRSITR